MAGIVAANLLGPLIGAAAMIAVGVGVGEVYEHKAPWGLEAQRDAARADLPKARAAGYHDGAAAQAALDKTAFDRWAADLKTCRDAAQASRNAQADAITAAAKFTSAQASAAYRLGRSSCGDPHAPAADRSAVPGSGGVQLPGPDFADDFDPAAYAPGSEAPVPGGGHR